LKIKKGTWKINKGSSQKVPKMENFPTLGDNVLDNSPSKADQAEIKETNNIYGVLDEESPEKKISRNGSS